MSRLKKRAPLKISIPKTETYEDDVIDFPVSEKDLFNLKKSGRGASKQLYFDEEFPEHLVFVGLKPSEQKTNKLLQQYYNELSKKTPLFFKIPKVYQRQGKFYMERVKDYDFHFKFTNMIELYDQRGVNINTDPLSIHAVEDMKLASVILKATGQFYALLKILNRGCIEVEVLVNSKTQEVYFIDFEHCEHDFYDLPKFIKKSIHTPKINYTDEEYEYLNQVFINAFNETVMAYNI